MSYKELYEKNAEFENKFRTSKLMLLLDKKNLKDEEAIFLLMDYVQPLSDNFQKCILLRYALNGNKLFADFAKSHLDEEYNHDNLLRNERQSRKNTWDPILEATASWFTLKMFMLDNFEKHFLIHSILESSAYIFFEKANKIVSDIVPSMYFKLHAECDEEHSKMGNDIYSILTKENFTSLQRLQTEGWEMIITVCNRIADIVNQFLEEKNHMVAKA